MIWVTSYRVRPSLLAISSGRRPCWLYSTASRRWDGVPGWRGPAGRAGAGRVDGRDLPGPGRAADAGGVGDAGTDDGAGVGAGGVGAGGVGAGAARPNVPRRWSWYLPSARSALVSSSSSRYCSADLFTPTATMVRP